MLRNTISPATDVLEVFRQLLERLTTIRLDRKRLMNATTEGPARARLDAMQSSLKILINSFYGYLGYSRGLFNDFARADEVTKTGQALLRQMIDHIQGLHGKVIEVDTDGVFFVPPESVVDEQSAREFVQALSDSMPQGISVALDGRYRKMLSYKKKNYALLTYEGKIRIKGSSLISRSMERFGRRYIQEVVDCLLTDNIERIHNLYTLLHDDIADHKLSIEDFARTETLKDSFAEYQKDVEAGKRNKSAAYEAAIATGNQYRPGDTVSYYITGNDPNPRSFEHCRHIEQWDPNFPDENVPYYLRRLDEFSEKFREFFEPEHFHSIFSTDSLFPFSAKGIITIVRDMREPPGPEEEPREDAGIWIDE